MLLQFHNVSAYTKEFWGINRLNLALKRRSRLLIRVNGSEQKELLQRLFEGKHPPEQGIIEKDPKLFLQSDRWWYGGRILDKKSGKWLGLCDPFFMFGSRKRTKEAFMDKLEARHIRHLPVYKLKDKDRFKFACLSMMFQESGIIILSNVIDDQYFQSNQKWVHELIENSHTAIGCIVDQNTLTPELDAFLKRFQWDEISLNKVEP